MDKATGQTGARSNRSSPAKGLSLGEAAIYWIDREVTKLLPNLGCPPLIFVSALILPFSFLGTEVTSTTSR